jgi:hypothetical protein
MPDPTVTDVFNQLVLVNGKLDQVEVNTSMMNNLNISINQGFAQTVNALTTIALINIETVKLLHHQTQQADTMICALEKISKNTCDILTQVAIQTRLQEHLRDAVDKLRYIAESAHSEAALEHDRHAELRAEIERCCPPKPPEPACKYTPCDRPEPVEKPRLPEIKGGHQNPGPVG